MVRIGILGRQRMTLALMLMLVKEGFDVEVIDPEPIELKAQSFDYIVPVAAKMEKEIPSWRSSGKRRKPMIK